MLNFLKIFVFVIAVIGSWFQESVYSDMYFDENLEEHTYIIGGEEYILLSDLIDEVTTLDISIDELQSARRKIVPVTTYSDIHKPFDKDHDSISFGDLDVLNFSFFSNSSPKQLLGYGWLYLCCLF